MLSVGWRYIASRVLGLLVLVGFVSWLACTYVPNHKGYDTMLVVIQIRLVHYHPGAVVFCCTDHCQIADHHAWYGFVGKSMVCCPDSLLDGSVVSLGFGYMIAGIGVVHDYV